MSTLKKNLTWGISTVGAIAAGIIALQVWANENFQSAEQAEAAAVRQTQQFQQAAAVQTVLHDKQNISRQLDYNETKLQLAEMVESQLIDEEDLSTKEQRELSRAVKNIEYYSEQLRVLKKKMRIQE